MKAKTRNKRMTVREAFRRTCLFKNPEYIPNMEFGPTSHKVLEQWYEEGLPRNKGPYADFQDFFKFDRLDGFWYGFYDPIPGVEGQGIVEETDEYRIIRNCWGSETKWLKKNGMIEGAHMQVKCGLSTEKDIERVLGSFDFNHPLRLPTAWDPSHPPLWLAHACGPAEPYEDFWKESWEEKIVRLKGRDFPYQLTGPSLMGEIKEAMGFENYCVGLYMQRDMIEKVMEARTVLGEQVIRKAKADIDFDILHVWEDMAFTHGPVIPPELFEEIVVPRHKRLVDAFKSAGGEIASVDSDGDIRALIPGWLKAGVNHFWPMEVKANMDVSGLRKEYGEAFSMRGGFRKTALFEGREAIDRELDRIASAVAGGGYIPMLDHQIPMGVPFENYCYYIEKKKELINYPV